MSKDSLVITNGMPVNNWLPKGINKISSISNKHNRILGLDLEGGNVANYGRHWFPQCTDFLELPEDKLFHPVGSTPDLGDTKNGADTPEYQVYSITSAFLPNSLKPDSKTKFQTDFIGRYIIAFTYCKNFHTWKVGDDVTTDTDADEIEGPVFVGNVVNLHHHQKRILMGEHNHSQTGTQIDEDVEFAQKYTKHQDCKEYGYKAISIDVKKDEKVTASNLDEYCSKKYADENRMILLNDHSVLSINLNNFERERFQNLRPMVKSSTMQLKKKTKTDQVYTSYAVIISHGVCRDDTDLEIQNVCYEIYDDKVIGVWMQHRKPASTNLDRPFLHELGNLNELLGGKSTHRADGQLQVLKNSSSGNSEVAGERSYAIHEDRILVVYKEIVDLKNNQWNVFQKTLRLSKRETEDVGASNFKLQTVKTVVDNNTKLNQPLSPNTSIKSVNAGKYECWYGQLYESSTQTCTKKNKCQVQYCVMIDETTSNCKACAQGYIVSADGRSCINLNNYPNAVDENCLYPTEKSQGYRVIRKIEDDLLKEKKQTYLVDHFHKELTTQCGAYAEQKKGPSGVNFYGMGRILRLLSKNKIDGFNIHSLDGNLACEKRGYLNFRQGECEDQNVNEAIDKLTHEWGAEHAYSLEQKSEIMLFLKQYRVEYVKKSLFKMCRTPFMLAAIADTNCGEAECADYNTTACTGKTFAECEAIMTANEKTNTKESNKTTLMNYYNSMCDKYKQLTVNDSSISLDDNLTVAQMLQALNWEHSIEMFDFFLLENEEHRRTLDGISPSIYDQNDHIEFHRCYTEYMDYTSRYIPIIKANACTNPPDEQVPKCKKANAVLSAFFVYLKKKSFERKGLLRKAYSCDSCRGNIKSSDLNSVHSAIDFLNQDKMHKAYLNNQSDKPNAMEAIKTEIIGLEENMNFFSEQITGLFNFFYLTNDDGSHSVSDFKKGDFLIAWMEPFKDLATDWYMLQDENLRTFRKEISSKLFLRDFLYYKDSLKYVDERVCGDDGSIINTRIEGLKLSVKNQLFRQWHSHALPEQLQDMTTEFVEYSKREMYKNAIKEAVTAKRADCSFTLTQEHLGNNAAAVVVNRIFPKLQEIVDKLQNHFYSPWGKSALKSLSTTEVNGMYLSDYAWSAVTSVVEGTETVTVNDNEFDNSSLLTDILSDIDCLTDGATTSNGESSNVLSQWQWAKHKLTEKYYQMYDTLTKPKLFKLENEKYVSEKYELPPITKTVEEFLKPKLEAVLKFNSVMFDMAFNGQLASFLKSTKGWNVTANFKKMIRTFKELSNKHLSTVQAGGMIDGETNELAPPSLLHLFKSFADALTTNQTDLTAKSDKTPFETKLLAKIKNVIANVDWDFERHVFETVMNKQRTLAVRTTNKMTEENARICHAKIEKKWATDNNLTETKNIVQCFQCRKCFMANRWHNPLDKESKACVHVSQALEDPSIMGHGYNAVCEAEVSANTPGEES